MKRGIEKNLVRVSFFSCSEPFHKYHFHFVLFSPSFHLGCWSLSLLSHGKSTTFILISVYKTQLNSSFCECKNGQRIRCTKCTRWENEWDGYLLLHPHKVNRRIWRKINSLKWDEVKKMLSQKKGSKRSEINNVFILRKGIQTGSSTRYSITSPPHLYIIVLRYIFILFVRIRFFIQIYWNRTERESNLSKGLWLNKGKRECMKEDSEVWPISVWFQKSRSSDSEKVFPRIV